MEILPKGTVSAYVLFRKISTSKNLVKLRYFTQKRVKNLGFKNFLNFLPFTYLGHGLSFLLFITFVKKLQARIRGGTGEERQTGLVPPKVERLISSLQGTVNSRQGTTDSCDSFQHHFGDFFGFYSFIYLLVFSFSAHL